MYGAIIAEDEMLVRVGLKSLINWNELGLALLSDASNGQEAFDMYNEYKPDIIITDIKMPKMDGIELMKKIRETDRRVRIIILTCLEEFEMIKKAMELEVDGYIVKLTMTSKEMETVLRRAIGKLKELGVPDKEDSSKSSLHSDEKICEVCKQYFVEFNYNSEEFDKNLDQQGVKLKGKKIAIAVMQIDHYGIFQSKYEKKDGKSPDVSILDLIGEVAKKSHDSYVINLSLSKYMIVFIMEGIVSESRVNDIAGNTILNIRNALKRYFDLSVSFGISSIRNDTRKLDTLYPEAVAALEFRLFSGIGTVNYLNEQANKSTIREKLDKLRVPPPLLDRLGCAGEYKSRVDHFIADGSFLIENVRNFFIHLLQMTALSSQIDKTIFEDLVISYSGIMNECETFDEMYATYEDFIKSAVNRNKERIAFSKGILDAVEYIKRHYSEDITLNHLADLVNLSPNYFSALFKKELNMNFSEYMINYRIERAKELLLGTRLLAYEISQRVGFTDGAYFSRTFKKVTGLSPNEYRKKWLER
ncbi:response regulator transcription factor [Paenibacillus cymbidii]|uniref:response regulator transcription factor n=1 Tax=Paenibacillus cymbidii TaxID=1639034 RepID=UPI0010801198|nr:response regulator [Paenibacillus cymbidii]